MNLLVLTPNHIWQKSCITFSGCSSFTLCKLLIPCKKCSITLCLVPLQLSVLPPVVGFIGPQVLPMSSCVQNPDTFHSSTTRNPDQADQPCIFHILGINGIIRTEKLHWPSPSAYCIYLPSPVYYYYPTSAKELKRISAKFRPGQDRNQERATRLTLTTMEYGSIDMWTLTGLMFTYLLWYVIPPSWRIQKELLSQLTCRDCRKTSFQIM